LLAWQSQGCPNPLGLVTGHAAIAKKPPSIRTAALKEIAKKATVDDSCDVALLDQLSDVALNGSRAEASP
jgi:hypothetical protein